MFVVVQAEAEEIVVLRKITEQSHAESHSLLYAITALFSLRIKDKGKRPWNCA